MVHNHNKLSFIFWQIKSERGHGNMGTWNLTVPILKVPHCGAEVYSGWKSGIYAATIPEANGRM